MSHPGVSPITSIDPERLPGTGDAERAQGALDRRLESVGEGGLEPIPDDGQIRVLHVITSLDRGGAENHLFVLLTNANRRRFHLAVAVLSGEGELVPQFRSAGITVHLLRARTRVDPLALRRLIQLIGDRHYHIVHSHLFRAEAYVALALSQTPKPHPLSVSTRHNDDRFFLNPFVGMAHYLLSSRQDMIIAISDHIARFTIARGVQDRSRVRRVYHGLDPTDGEEFERERARIRQDLGLNPGDFLVGNVGRLAPQKGQRHLVAAVPALLAAVPGAHVAIVGIGALEPRLRSLAESLGVLDHVHLLGPRHDVPAFMRAVDVFAMPSIWEGFGIVLLEAMAAARPIVASRVATIPEVVLDGETGILVPAGDPDALAAALVRLAEDPAEAGRLGEAGRQRLRSTFSLTKMVGDTELLYEELLGTVS